MMNVAKMAKFIFDGVENIVGKGENAGYHNGCKRFLSQGCLSKGLCGERLQTF